MKGVRAGLVVLTGIAIGNVATAIYHLLSARWLGPNNYADLAALLALLGLVSFPLAGAQFSVARAVSHARATTNQSEIRRVIRLYLRWTAALGALATVALAGAAPWLSDVLGLDATAIVIGSLALLPGFALPVIIGLIQGLQRFMLFATAQVAVPVSRTLLLVAAIAWGGGVNGAMAANAAAFLGTLFVLAWVLRRWLRQPHASHLADLRSSSVLVPAIGGILAFTSLTTLDVVVAKLALPDSDAGLYGAASVLGRLILFLPAAVAAVLLPRVTSRLAAGRETRSMLLASMAVTGVVALVATVLYAVVPEPLLRIAYGSDFTGATPLLWKFGLAMTLFAVVNVLFVYDIGRSRSRTFRLMAAAAVVQVIGFAFFHESATELVAVDIGVGAALAFAAFSVIWFARGTRPEPGHDPS